MNINRYNYEEYLMLYIDGELSPSEKLQVEAFLQQNPDVKEELELLQQTVLQPEHIAFDDKRSLYKRDTGINLNNYQEYFLLYIDNELSFVEKEAVETFVLQHPQLQDEFTLLKQTVLPQEQLVFTNKEVLYRKEEKKRPVVISINYRWASLAAAVMIGIVALVWIFRADNSVAPTNGPTAGTTKTTQPKNNDQKDNDQLQPSQTIPSINNNDQSLAVEEGKKQDNIIPKENANQPQPAVTKENIAALNDNNQQREQQQTIAATQSDNQVSSTTNITIPKDISVDADGDYSTVAVTPSATNDNNFAVKPVVNQELNVGDEDDKKTLLVGSMQINKDKLRGFFRKAGRLLGSKVKSDDGKLQVANMEINK